MGNYNWVTCTKGQLSDLFAAPFSQFGEFVTLQSWKEEFSKEEKYEPKNSMLLIDCRGLTTQETVELVPEMKEMLEHDQPVMLMYPKVENKRALADEGVLGVFIEDSSLALFIEPQRRPSGKLCIALAEQYGGITSSEIERTVASFDGEGNKTKEDTSIWTVEENYQVTLEDIQPFINRIRHSMHTLVDKKEIVSSNNVGPNNPPGETPDSLWENTPYNLYYPICYRGGAAGSFVPPEGTATMEALLSVGIYYDNKKYTTPIQWVYIEHSGHVYVHLNQDNADQRGWSLGSLAITGDNISSPDFICHQSAPNNVSETREYTTSTEFSVGLTAGTEGIAADISYTIGSSETCSISDWVVLQQTPNAWQLRQNTPYSGDITDFPEGCAGYDGVVNLPVISKSTLAFNTQSTWIHNPASKSGSRSLNYNYEVITHYVCCDEHKATEWHAWHWGSLTRWFKVLNIDFSKAYPKS